MKIKEIESSKLKLNICQEESKKCLKGENKKIKNDLHNKETNIFDNNKIICQGKDLIDLKTKNALFEREFSVLEKLGSGGSGDTYRVNAKRSNKLLAVKYIKKKSKMFENSNDEVFKKIVLNEINIQFNVGNKFITRSHGYFTIGNEAYAIIQELADRGNLKEFLNNFQKNQSNYINSIMTISESMVGYISFFIVNALNHLFALDVIHQDIKSENLLVNEHFDLKLTDFTISVKLNLSFSEFTFSGHGTNCFISPENLKKESVPLKESHKSDYFSFGILIYKYLFGIYPYKVNSSDSKDVILEKYCNNMLDFPDRFRVSIQVKDFLSKLLKIDYKERLNLNQILNHVWIKNFESLKILKNIYHDSLKFIIDLMNDDIFQLKENLIF